MDMALWSPGSINSRFKNEGLERWLSWYKHEDFTSNPQYHAKRWA